MTGSPPGQVNFLNAFLGAVHRPESSYCQNSSIACCNSIIWTKHLHHFQGTNAWNTTGLMALASALRLAEMENKCVRRKNIGGKYNTSTCFLYYDLEDKVTTSYYSA